MSRPRSIRRILRGKSRHLSDLDNGSRLTVIPVVSQRASARLTAVVPPILPDRYFFIDATAVPGANSLCFMDDCMPIFAGDRVRFVGQPIGMVVGPNPALVQELADQVRVDYADEPACFDFGPPIADGPTSVVVHQLTKQVGDPEAVFAGSAHVIEGIYRTGGQARQQLEPLGATADWRAGSLTIHTPTQWPHQVRTAVLACLKPTGSKTARAPAVVRVVATSTGVHADSRLVAPALAACQAAICAHVTGRSVSLVYPRAVEWAVGSKLAPLVAVHRTALSESGDVTAMTVAIFVDCGAFALFTREIAMNVLTAAFGVYAGRHLAATVSVCSTNNPPANLFNGSGSAQAIFAMECHVDRLVAAALDHPLSWRIKQLLSPSAPTITGIPAEMARSRRALLSRLSEISDFSRRFAAYELQKKRRANHEEELTPTSGIGMAICYAPVGFAGRVEERLGAKVRVRMDKSGKVHLSVSTINAHPATKAYWRDLIIAQLAVDDADVVIDPPDTDIVPDSGPAYAGRGMTIIPRLIRNCCNALKKRRFRAPLPLEVTRSYQLPRSRKWDEATLTGDPFVARSWAAIAVEVAFDPQAFTARVGAVWMTIDGGSIINSGQAMVAIEAAVMDAIHWAVGRQVGAGRSAVPEALPAIDIRFLGRDAGLDGREQPVGIGDLPLAGVPAAYLQALNQACGCYLDRVPTTARLLFDWTRNGGGGVGANKR